MDKKLCNSSQDPEVRKGPWTMEEDLILINYIANHGEGVWNSLAKAAGLRRTGKSCRLRWLNYLRPDVRRGNITPEEQLLIMELHAKWGNRAYAAKQRHLKEIQHLTYPNNAGFYKWSKIAKHLPGRTDNEIKNFWRTRIQKQMKQSENLFQQQQGCSSDQINDPQASTSQLSTISEPMEPYSNSSSYQQLLEPFSAPPQFPATIPDNQNQTSTTCSTNDNNNNNYWSMEDFWSMQLLNGD